VGTELLEGTTLNAKGKGDVGCQEDIHGLKPFENIAGICLVAISFWIYVPYINPAMRQRGRAARSR
jgi:hypothetical protein